MYGEVRGQQVYISSDCIYNGIIRQFMDPKIRTRLGASKLKDFVFAFTTGTTFSISHGKAIRDTKERYGLRKYDIIHATAYRLYWANITARPAFLKN